jgi:putative copper export protein
MNGGLIVMGIVRGLHDVSSAVWAGGLLTMALAVIPTMRSLRPRRPKQKVGTGDDSGGSVETSETERSGRTPLPAQARFMVLLQQRLRKIVTVAIVSVFATGLLLLRLSLRSTGGLDPRSPYGAILIAKIVLSVVMVVLAIIRSAKLRALGDRPAEPEASGISLLLANAALAVVVLLLSGFAGAIG